MAPVNRRGRSVYEQKRQKRLRDTATIGEDSADHQQPQEGLEARSRACCTRMVLQASRQEQLGKIRPMPVLQCQASTLLSHCARPDSSHQLRAALGLLGGCTGGVCSGSAGKPVLGSAPESAKISTGGQCSFAGRSRPDSCECRREQHPAICPATTLFAAVASVKPRSLGQDVHFADFPACTQP